MNIRLKAALTGLGAALLALLVGYTSGQGINAAEILTAILAFLLGAGYISLADARVALADAQAVQEQLKQQVEQNTIQVKRMEGK